MKRPTQFWVLVATIVVVTVTAMLGYFGQGREWMIVVRPGGAVFDDSILPTFFVLFLVSAVVAVRWPLAAGILAAFTFAALVPFAVNQLESWSAFLVLVVFGLPAIVWLSLGIRRRSGSPPRKDLSRRQAIVTITGVVVAAAGGSVLGRYVYDRIWGPTHPESDTPPLPDSALDWFWCGAVTTSECVVRARPRRPFENARLLLGSNAALDDASDVPFANVYDRVLEFRVNDLRPDTTYFYGVELDGELDRVRTGSFRTFPSARQPVRMVFASCARIGSNGAVFDAVRAQDPLVYVCIGDFHYGDTFVDDVDDYRQVFDVQLTQPAQAALYSTVPVAYVWDDHDYGPNDSHRLAPGRNAAMVAYREYVPHYEVAGPDSAIFQAFSIGTVRVILTDARSARDPHEVPDTADKSMLGVEQRDWLLDELTASSASHDLVIWVSPVPWVDRETPGGDTWGGYTSERTLIAEHIADGAIDNLLMVGGDAHMVAIDDGTNTNYSSKSGSAFPLIHVAALDRPGSEKGGPYTYGPIAGGGQFAVVDVGVTDDGRSLDVGLSAINWRGDELLSHRFAVPTIDA